MNIPEKNYIELSFELNLIVKWMNELNFESIFAIFLLKALFWSILHTFGQFLGTFPNWPVSMIPGLLNWIIFWIESAEVFLNWIIFWMESWVKQYWIKYWMNYFLAKFKHWIESDWVLATITSPWSSGHPGCSGYLSHPSHPHHTHHSPLGVMK